MIARSLARKCLLAIAPNQRMLVQSSRNSVAFLSVGGILCCCCPTFISAFLISTPQPRPCYHPLPGGASRPLISYPSGSLRTRLLSRATGGGGDNEQVRKRGGRKGSKATSGASPNAAQEAGDLAPSLLSISEDFDAFDVEEMNVEELQQKLGERMLSTQGDVQDLRDRLMQHLLQKMEVEERQLDSAFQKIPNKPEASGTKARAPRSVNEDEEVEGEGGEADEMSQDATSKRWIYLDIDSIPLLTTEQVKEALNERGLEVEGSDKKLRAALRKAIEREEGEEEEEGGEEEEGREGEQQLAGQSSSKGKGNDNDMITVEEVMSLKQSDLKEILKSYGLPSSGTKSVLQGRLMEHIEELQGKTSSSASPAVKTEEVLGAFDNALEEWFGVGDGTKGVFRKKAKQGFCPGCGCKLQSTMQTAPGYVPESKTGEEKTVCARCYSLQHYGKVDPDLTAQNAKYAEVSPATFRSILAPLKKQECIICYVVDIFDFHGTFLPDLKDIVGRNPVVLAVNKADLLPSSFRRERVKQWVREEARDLGAPQIVDVVLISATTGYGVKLLEQQLRSWSSRRKQNIYIAGAANVGKSTLVNRLLAGDFSEVGETKIKVRGKLVEDEDEIRMLEKDMEQDGRKREAVGKLQTFKMPDDFKLELDEEDGEEEEEEEKERGLAPDFEYKEKRKLQKHERDHRTRILRGMQGGVTTSFLPGTTLDVTELDLGNGYSMFDTPGIIVPAQLTNILTMQELAFVLPQQRVEHVTYRIPSGSCVHLSAMVRIELLSEKPFFFTIFVSNKVSVHVGKSSKAEEFRWAQVGRMLKPPMSAERLKAMGELEETVLQDYGDSWDVACVDVVVAGFGWVALTGIGPLKVRVMAPKGVGVTKRTPLMPYEARTSTESYTGGGDKKGNSRRTKKLTLPGNLKLSRGKEKGGRTY